MTQYTLTIDGSPQNFELVKFELSNEVDPDPWDAILTDETGGEIAPEDSLVIARDGTTIFQGIVEWREPVVNETGKRTIQVGGRQTKVLLWRKWNERYNDTEGFFSSMYPNKIVEFLTRPSFSAKPERGDTYKRIGTGIDPITLTATASMATDEDRGAEKVLNRLDLVGMRSTANQANGDYIEIDLGEAKTICAMAVMNKTTRPIEYAKSYRIQRSSTGAWGGEEVTVATQSNNKAINIIESWTPVSAQYWRIQLTANSTVQWSVSNIFVYESDGAISGISIGTIDEHVPFNCSELTQNASSGQVYVYCDEWWRFKEGDDVLVMDDGGWEEGEVASVDEDNERIVLESNLASSYLTADNALLMNLYATTEINLEYNRRSESIHKIVELCMTSGTKWQWEVTNSGVVNMGLRTGSDLTSSIVFARGTNIVDASARRDDRKRIDRVLVIGGGKGDYQDINSSGWVGTGEYEQVFTYKDAESEETSRAKAEEYINEYGSGYSAQQLVVHDTYATNAWGVDDEVTFTDSYTGLSGGFRVKKIVRAYSGEGEMVTIHATNRVKTHEDMIAELIKAIEYSRQKRDPLIEPFDGITDDPRYMYKFEAEELVLDSDVGFVADPYASGKKYIEMSSLETGNVITGGPAVTLEAGKYRVHFICQVSSNASVSDLVTLTVKSATLGGTLESNTIQPNLFYVSSQWCNMSFTFEVDRKVEDVEFEIDGFVSGITNFFCDYIAITSNEIPDIPPGPPSAPTGLVATGVELAMEVDWDENTETDLSFYEIYRDTSSPAGTKIAEALTSYFIDRDVSQGVTYYYRVKAVDWSRQASAYSNEDSGAPTTIQEGWLAEIDDDWLAIETRKWIHNMGINWFSDEANDYASPDYNRIYWGKGGTFTEGVDADNSAYGTDAEVTYAGDPTTSVGINLGTQDALADGIHFLYWNETEITDTKYDIQIASGIDNYGDAVGPGKGIIGIVKINNTDSEPPTMIPVDSYIPYLGAGVINAVSILSKHITASEWIEGKKFQTSGSGSRIEWDTSGIRAYSATNKTVDIDTANGFITVIGSGTHGTGGSFRVAIGGAVYGWLDAFLSSTDEVVELRGDEQIWLNVGGDVVSFDQGGEIIIDENFTAIRPSDIAEELDIGTTTYHFNAVYVKSAAPTHDKQLANKKYVDDQVSAGLGYLDPIIDIVNFVTSEPTGMSSGDRYLNTATGDSSVTTTAVIADYIYEWNGSAWTNPDGAPSAGDTVYVTSDGSTWNYNGASWVQIGGTVDHNSLTNLQGGDTDEYYHLDQTEYTRISAIGALAITDSNFIVGNGSTWVAESGATARTSIGLGTGNSPTFTGLTLSGLLDVSVQQIPYVTTGGVLATETAFAYNSSTNKLTVQTAEFTAVSGAPFVVNSDTVVTDLNADLLDGIEGSAFVRTSRTITAGDGLYGGGNLSSNRTLEVDIFGIEDVTNPGADRILFFDLTFPNAFNWLRAGTFISISADYLNVDIHNIAAIGTPSADRLLYYNYGSGGTDGLEWLAIGSGLELDDLTNVLSVDTSSIMLLGTNQDVDSDKEWQDNKYVKFGTDGDFGIRYNSSNTRWQFISDPDALGTGPDEMIEITSSVVTLYYVAAGLSVARLATSSAGIEVSGGVEASGEVEGNTFAIGATTIVTSGRTLQNVFADTSILTSGTLAVARGGLGYNLTGGSTYDEVIFWDKDNLRFDLFSGVGGGGKYLGLDVSGNLQWASPISGGDHGSLVGLEDDDHTQYILASGSRAFTGDVTLGDGVSGDELLTLLAESGTSSILNLKEISQTYGVSFEYDGSVNFLYIRVHNNSTIGTVVTSWERTTGIITHYADFLAGPSGTYDIGGSGNEWTNIYMKGLLYLDTDQDESIFSTGSAIGFGIGGVSELIINNSEMYPYYNHGLNLGTLTNYYDFIYGRYITCEVLSSKPSPSPTYAGTIIITNAGGSAKSYVWACVENSSDSYEWVQLAIST